MTELENLEIVTESERTVDGERDAHNHNVTYEFCIRLKIRFTTSVKTFFNFVLHQNVAVLAPRR